MDAPMKMRDGVTSHSDHTTKQMHQRECCSAPSTTVHPALPSGRDSPDDAAQHPPTSEAIADGYIADSEDRATATLHGFPRKRARRSLRPTIQRGCRFLPHDGSWIQHIYANTPLACVRDHPADDDPCILVANKRKRSHPHVVDRPSCSQRWRLDWDAANMTNRRRDDTINSNTKSNSNTHVNSANEDSDASGAEDEELEADLQEWQALCLLSMANRLRDDWQRAKDGYRFQQYHDALSLQKVSRLMSS